MGRLHLNDFGVVMSKQLKDTDAVLSLAPLSYACRYKKVKLLMQAPPTDPRTMPAIRMKAQVPCGQQQKM